MKYLVFAKDERVYRQLQNALSLFEEQILVKPGHDFVEINNCQYEINPKNPAHYRQLLATFSEQLPERVIFLWSWESASSQTNNIDQKLTNSVYSVFLLTQALLKAKPQSVIELFYCYSRSEGQSQPHHDAMGAFAKTVHLESKKVKLKVIAVSGDSSLSKLLCEEIEHYHNDVEIR
ncbi:MAG: KR prefix domain-containing protein, partial [Waterburya sp.]